LFEHTGITFRILDNRNVLLRKTENYISKPAMLKLNGRVLDYNTGLAIAYASVYLDTLGIGVQTDEKGHFSLMIPAVMKDRKLHFRMLGYQELVREAHACMGFTDVWLSEKPFELDAITIEERLPPVLTNPQEQALVMREFSKNIASHLLSGDPLRQIQLLPGISASDDLNSGISIRGDAEDGTLIVLDGIPIYKATHFYGIFSAINGDYLNEARLYKNTLPVAFGGKTGGMVQMKSAADINQFSLKADINLLTSSLNLQIPLGEKFDLLLAGRSTYQNVGESKFFDIANKPVVENETRENWLSTQPDYKFHDLNARLIYQIDDWKQLDINLFHSSDNLDNDYEIEYELGDRIFRSNIFNKEVFRQQEDWNNLGLSLNYHYKTNRRTSLNVTGYYAKYRNEGSVSSLISQELPVRVPVIDLENTQYNVIRDLGGKMSFKIDLDKKRYVEGGLEVVSHENEFLFQEDTIKVLKGNDQGLVTAAFSNYHWVGPEAFSLDVGTRISHYSVTDELFFSPRIRLNYELGKQLLFKGAFSVNHQFVREITHENRLGQSLGVIRLSDHDQYPVAQSRNWMLGATYRRPHWTLDIELFRKDISNVVEHALSILRTDSNRKGTVTTNRYRAFSGTGNSMGIDAIVSLNLDSYNGWIAYTLSKNEQSFDEILNGTWFSAQDDRRHQIKWVNTIALGKFTVSANYIYISGRPYTNLSLISDETDRRTLKPSDRIDRLPSYQRLDLGLNYQMDTKWGKMDMGISLFNTLDRDNVKYLQYIYSFTHPSVGITRNQVVGTETQLLDRTLNLNLSFQL